MLFDDEVIELIEENPLLGLKRALEIGSGADFNSDDQRMNQLEEVVLFCNLVIEEYEIQIPKINLEPSINDSISFPYDYLEHLASKIDMCQRQLDKLISDVTINQKMQLYASALKSSFAYEFSQGDIDKIQSLVNELRSEITDSDLFEVKHKQRLLKRLEKLQTEMHKRMSDLDRFWGLIGDAGVVIGKLGKDAKPIVDRIKELSQIVWNTQARAEELPSGSENPMIEHSDSD